MKIRNIMTTSIVTADADASLETVQAIFSHCQFHHLLVLDNNRLYGVLSDRDLLKAISPYAGTISELPRDAATMNKRIHQIMSRQPVTVSPECTLQDAIRLLLENNISCLPVLAADGQIEGIITWKDLLRTYKEDKD
jgi:acetoin utilization protein AcuB